MDLHVYNIDDFDYGKNSAPIGELKYQGSVIRTLAMYLPIKSLSGELTGLIRA